MSKVAEIASREDFQQALDNNRFVVVDFWAQWCGPCHQFRPTYDKVSDKFDKVDDVMFVSVDVEASPWATEEFKVRSIPNVQMFKNGQFHKKLQERRALPFMEEITALIA